LRMRLKENELEQYGEAFTPDFVYNVINRLPRFSTMRVSYDSRIYLRQLLIIDSEDTNKMQKNS
jgi:hypothetical protein